MPAHGLGPHIVGQRVVLRRILPGETGPTGGPAFTDLLGELAAWEAGEAGEAVVRTEDGVEHRVPTALVVSGKPVPPRPSPLLRIPAARLQHSAARCFPAATVERLGGWLLRDDVDVDPYTCDARRVARRTSALAVGDPGLPLGEAVAEVARWYEARGRRAWASVVAGSSEQAAFADAGWVPAREEEPSETWVGSVARVLRRLEEHRRDDVRLQEAADPAAPGLAVWQAVAPAGGGPAYPALASGRCAADPRDPDTVILLGLTTAAASRRAGLARAVLHALLERAAERGARTVQLHVLGSSHAATSLYASAGLQRHHRCVYLAAPA